jgi:DNA-binding MarR family transcriptional regulator
MATRRDEEITRLTQELKKSEAELAKARTDLSAAQKKIAQLDPADLSEDEITILKHMGTKDEGFRFHELESVTSFSTVKTTTLVQKLERRGFLLRHAGESTTRLKFDKPGLDYVLRNKLI